MRVADLRVHSIAIADPPLRSSYGLHAPFALRTILELESEDGIVGISETHGGEANAHVHLAEVSSRRDGSVAFVRVLAPWSKRTQTATARRRACRARIQPTRPRAPACAIEIACLDLIGKTVGVAGLRFARRPRERRSAVLRLPFLQARMARVAPDRAGRVRRVPGPEAMVRQARQMIENTASSSIKLKAGVLDPTSRSKRCGGFAASSVRGPAAHGPELRVDARDVDSSRARAPARARRRRVSRRSDAHTGRHGGAAAKVWWRRGRRDAAREQRRGHVIRGHSGKR